MSGKYSKEFADKFFEALKNRLGIVSSAAADVGVTAETVRVWRKTHPEFEERYNEINEYQKDVVENRLFNMIQEGNVQAIIFYMRTKCRDRGYVDIKTAVAPKKEEAPVKEEPTAKEEPKEPESPLAKLTATIKSIREDNDGNRKAKRKRG